MDLMDSEGYEYDSLFLDGRTGGLNDIDAKSEITSINRMIKQLSQRKLLRQSNVNV